MVRMVGDDRHVSDCKSSRSSCEYPKDARVVKAV